MAETLRLMGMVLSSKPIGEYDNRLVLLTRERGKISAFAKGARKPTSPFLAVSRPFAFGYFECYAGRSSYTLKGAEILNYFEELGGDLERVCFASYFAELADYYTREAIDESQMLLLLYQALRALIKASIPNRLVRAVYELKAMAINGEYLEKLPVSACPSTVYTLQFIVNTSVERLYTFAVSDQVLGELEACVYAYMQHFINRKFHSLEILESLCRP